MSEHRATDFGCASAQSNGLLLKASSSTMRHLLRRLGCLRKCRTIGKTKLSTNALFGTATRCVRPPEEDRRLPVVRSLLDGRFQMLDGRGQIISAVVTNTCHHFLLVRCRGTWRITRARCCSLTTIEQRKVVRKTEFGLRHARELAEQQAPLCNGLIPFVRPIESANLSQARLLIRKSCCSVLPGTHNS